MNFIKKITESFNNLTRLSSDEEEKIKKNEENNKHFIVDIEKGMSDIPYCTPNSFLRGKTSDTGIVDVDTSNYLSGRNDKYSKVNSVKTFPINLKPLSLCEDNEKYIYLNRNPRKKENGLSEIDTSQFDFDFYPRHSHYHYNSFNFKNSRKE